MRREEPLGHELQRSLAPRVGRHLQPQAAHGNWFVKGKAKEGKSGFQGGKGRSVKGVLRQDGKHVGRKGKLGIPRLEPGYAFPEDAQLQASPSCEGAEIFAAFHQVTSGSDTSGDAEHQALCSLVKRMQRTSDRLCALWWNWCQMMSGGWRDPRVHTLESLRHFFASAEAGIVPNHYVETDHNNWWHEELVRRVKHGQRCSPDFKIQWWRYCDTFGNTVRDPGRHESTFVETFLAHWDNNSINSLYSESQIAALPAQSVEL